MADGAVMLIGRGPEETVISGARLSVNWENDG
jgi:hypothetical protein